MEGSETEASQHSLSALCNKDIHYWLPASKKISHRACHRGSVPLQRQQYQQQQSGTAQTQSHQGPPQQAQRRATAAALLELQARRTAKPALNNREPGPRPGPRQRGQHSPAPPLRPRRTTGTTGEDPVGREGGRARGRMPAVANLQRKPW